VCNAKCGRLFRNRRAYAITERTLTNYSLQVAAIIFVLVAPLAFMIATAVDPIILDPSGVYLTDEGWYSKSSLLLARDGIIQRASDFDFFTSSLLHTIILSSGFFLFDSTLAVARFTAMLVYCAGLSAFLISASRSPYYKSCIGVVLLAIAVNIYSLTQGRLALTDTVATGFLLGSTACWIAYRGRKWAFILSLLLAAFTFFTKSSYLFFIVSITLLWLWSAYEEHRAGHRKTALVLAFATFMTLVVCAAFLVGVAKYYLEDYALFSKNFDRIISFTVRQIISRPARSLFNMLTSSGALALIVAAVAGIFVLWRADRAKLIGILSERATVACLLMVIVGTAQFGFSVYQPARYYLFTIAPITATAIALVWAAGGAVGRTRLSIGILMLAHVATQIVSLQIAANRRQDSIYASVTSTSLSDATKNFAAAIDQHVNRNSERIFLLGHGEAALLALADQRIRPLDFEGVGPLCSRVERWRPEFVLVSENGPTAKYFDEVTNCPEVRQLRPIASATPLGDYYKAGRLVLYDVTYNSAGLSMAPSGTALPEADHFP
jgi:hypothetical protein